jgi:thiol-disulfide isomerase/thioredoxin
VVLAHYLTAALNRDVTQAVPLLPAGRPALHDSALARQVRGTYTPRLLLANGQPAPAINVRDASGKPVSLADYRGQVVYLDFWACWCRPCMAEVPAGEKLKKQFEGKDVVFLYVPIDEEEANWKKALANHPPHQPQQRTRLGQRLGRPRSGGLSGDGYSGLFPHRPRRQNTQQHGPAPQRRRNDHRGPHHRANEVGPLVLRFWLRPFPRGSRRPILFQAKLNKTTVSRLYWPENSNFWTGRAIKPPLSRLRKLLGNN